VKRTQSIFVVFLMLFCAMFLIGAEKYSLTIDATKQMAPPARGRGPFPRSVIPDYVPDLSLKVELAFPDGRILSNGNVLMDFVITNTGGEAIRFPLSVHQPSFRYWTSGMTDVLTLFFTADEDAIGVSMVGKKPNVASNGLMGIYGTSVELYGRPDDPQTYYLLAPKGRILVHASSRMPLRAGIHTFAGHAELSRTLADASGMTSKLIGIVDSVPVKKRLLLQAP